MVFVAEAKCMCSTCIEHRTSALRNTQDSASVGSTSTTSTPSTTSGFTVPISFPTPSPWGTPPHTPSPSCFGTPCVSSRPVSHAEPTQLFRHNGYGFCESAASIPGTMQAPVQASRAWATTTTSSPFPKPSPFGTPPAVTSFSSASTQSPKPFGFPSQASSAFDSTSPFRPPPAVTTQSPFGFGSFAAPKPFGSPFQSSSSAFGNGVGFTRPDVAFSQPSSNQTTNTFGFATTPVNVPSVFTQSTPKSPFSSSFPPFGDSYLPGTGANSLRSSPFSGGGCTVSAVQSTFTGIPSCGWNSDPTGEGSRHTRYAPTPDHEIARPGHLMVSISASGAYRHKSHEELRWEDYRYGDKGVSMPNTAFTPSTVSPSLFQPQRTTQGNMFTYLPTGPSNVLPTSSSTPSTAIPTAPVPSSVQRPHETNHVSTHAYKCTACGANSRPSPSGYSIFNGPATPPPLFSNAGYFPMMFGGMAPAFQAYPMMFGANMPGQGTTTPAMQAFPVQGFLILPFAAMNLQTMQDLVEFTIGSGASATSPSSTSSPVFGSSSPVRPGPDPPPVTLVGSASMQALGKITFSVGGPRAPRRTILRSRKAHVQGGLFPGPHNSPTGSRPGTVFSSSTVSVASSSTSACSGGSVFGTSSLQPFDFGATTTTLSPSYFSYPPSSTWGAPPHTPAFGTSTPSCFGTPLSSTSVSSTEQTQSFGLNGYDICESAVPIPGTMQAPVQASIVWATTTTSSPFPMTSPFGIPPAVTSFSFASTQTPFGCGSFAAPSRFQSSSSTFADHTPSFATTPVIVPLVFATSTPKSPFSSSFPAFGAGANSLRLFAPFSGGGCTVSAAQSTFTSIPSGSRHTRYAPTIDHELVPAGRMMVSISASGAYRHKSHEELRWEDYQNGDKGSMPNAVSTVSHSTFAPDCDKRETGVSMPNTAFTPSTVSPSLFQPQRTTQGNMFTNVLPTSSSTPSTTIPTVPVPSSGQRPHETNDVSSSHTSGCTACGAASSPSPSGYSIFNGPATTPPLAPWPFFSNAGYVPMMFGGMAPTFQAYPMMFGTYLPGQGTTTLAMQPYPVQGFLILPFASMNLQ